jgi:GH15 family glucan-1,4-alpha-glucosidase
MYHPIDSYGVIGNMKTAALVGPDGGIDWLCLPRFDSPSVFGALLDARKGGRFRLDAAGEAIVRDTFYLPDTNVLVTRFLGREGVGEVMDFMPVGASRHDRARPDLVRIARGEYGRSAFHLRCAPAFDYARAGHTPRTWDGGAVFEAGGHALSLASTVPLRLGEDGTAGAEFVLGAGECAAFALRFDENGPGRHHPFSVCEALDLKHDTVRYWEEWIGGSTYRGRWREAVRRSALALKLMTYEQTGAIVAAPTTSLPEHVGGTRNWDYRYTWPRDAAFTVYALQRIGLFHEAAHFMEWLRARCEEHKEGEMLLPLYTIDGKHAPEEIELAHLEGYRGSGPVRIGNGAGDQLQIDVIGSVMDAAYLHNKHGSPLSHDLWVELRDLLDGICRNWSRKDHGVWEFRSRKRDFVYSKLMAWVGLDRGVRLAASRALPADVERWRKSRDEIYNWIMEKGWDEERRAFVMEHGNGELDAANLIMPLVFFVAPDDPRMLATIDAINRPLKEGGLTDDFLIHRYHPENAHDGIDEQEGAFSMCSFWMIEALNRAGRMDRGLVERARILLQRMLNRGGRLGLYSEQLDPYDSGNGALGNYPQALTHLSLITAAINLDRALDDGDR